jgi:hypothetical protein
MFAPLIHKLAATDRRRNIRTSTATAYTLVPMLVVWIIVYGLVAIGRWIAAGFGLKKS